jgi:hypothetical protein
VAQLYLQALSSLFVASYDSQGYGGRYSNPPPHGVKAESKSELLCDWRLTSNQFVWVASPLRLTANSFLAIEHLRS